MDVGDAWTKSDTCTRIPGLVGPLLCEARLLYGDGVVSSGHRFSMLGVKGGAGIQLVLDRRHLTHVLNGLNGLNGLNRLNGLSGLNGVV